MRPFSRIHRVACSTIALGALSLPAQTPATPAAKDELAALQTYAGAWKVQIDTLDTPQSKAAHEETSLRNDCWRSGGYFACNQYVNGESKILIVFTYDAANKHFTSYQVPQNGSPASSGVLEITGNTWIFPWTQTQDGKTIHWRVVNVIDSPKHITYRREFSSDQVNWIVIARGSETKSD